MRLPGTPSHAKILQIVTHSPLWRRTAPPALRQLQRAVTFNRMTSCEYSFLLRQPSRHLTRTLLYWRASS
jgi:hypothetical protein